jgi:phosphoserine phosphatase
VPPLKLSPFKLAAFDMYSTLINIECVDETADAIDLLGGVRLVAGVSCDAEGAKQSDGGD